jgi:wyosine [tRNA(Phe)-imidazoG37] synthetase (radical SAM superfamily)
MPIPLQERVVYGPVASRRLGQSLGVNILPRDLKVCNMNCAYCQYNWTRERRGIGA